MPETTGRCAQGGDRRQSAAMPMGGSKTHETRKAQTQRMTMEPGVASTPTPAELTRSWDSWATAQDAGKGDGTAGADEDGIEAGETITMMHRNQRIDEAARATPRA